MANSESYSSKYSGSQVDTAVGAQNEVADSIDTIRTRAASEQLLNKIFILNSGDSETADSLYRYIGGTAVIKQIGGTGGSGGSSVSLYNNPDDPSVLAATDRLAGIYVSGNNVYKVTYAYIDESNKKLIIK